MVIVGLLTHGVGLALDAYAERQSSNRNSRDQRRNTNFENQDAGFG